MSFFKKALSSIGIGAAKVDTVLDQDHVAPGEPLSGIVYITGGKAEQLINKIDLDVRCNFFKEETYEEKVEGSEDEVEERTRIVECTATLVAYDIDEQFEIQPGEKREIPFDITLPLASPLTLGQSKTWVETNLDIDFAFDKQDKDYLNVCANPLQQAVFDALISLGFSLHEAENEAISNFQLPFIQEFEFKTHGGEFNGRLDEVEVIFVNNEEYTEVILEIDRKAKGIGGFFANLFAKDETMVKLDISEDNIDDIEAILSEIIDEHC